MERKFNTAIEARRVTDELRLQLGTINFNKDLFKYLHNIEKMVSILSSAEVRARQSHKPSLVDKPRDNLANALDYLEKMIIIAKLSE